MTAPCKNCPREIIGEVDEEAYRIVPCDAGTEQLALIPCRACRYQLAPKAEGE